MRFLTCATAFLFATWKVDSFTSPNAFLSNSISVSKNGALYSSSFNKEAFYESLMSEGGQQHQQKMSRKSKIVLPESSAVPSDIEMASTLVAPSQPQMYTDEADELFGGGVDAAEDFLSSQSLESESSTMEQTPNRPAHNRAPGQTVLQKKKFFFIKYTTDGKSLGTRWSEGDYYGIITNYMVPLTAIGVGLGWSGRKLLTRYNSKLDSLLGSYANEMVYHDGDFDEMKMAHSDYKKKLVTLGPNKKNSMIKSYLELFAKKKPVSPQAISTLSYVFSMYNLSEEAAAKVLVEVAQSMTDKLASAGKLLFYGERILKSAGGQVALQPIRQMLEDSYRSGGSLIVATSQKTMGEAAYRATVAAAGSEQNALTTGWEVLGLEEERAREIFAEVAETGFKSKREIEYGGVRQKYDAKGRKVDDEGKLLDPSEAKDDDDDDDSGSSSSGGGNVYECGSCGYTLFTAKGRDFKFFPDGYTCPECGAAKDQFISK